MSFVLQPYLERVGMPARPTLDAAGLQRLQFAHRTAIPFENLDIRLGRGIAIDSASVFAKLVGQRRGGYCFEQNRLFLDALTELGFEARPLLARVWLGAEATPPLTHTLSLVTLGGAPWIADAGFGGSYAPVMPLVDGATATAPDGATFRLAHEGGDWTLWREGNPATTDGRNTAPGWQRQFSFTTAEVPDADLAMGNWWTQSHPDSRFVRHVLASIILPHGFAKLTDRAYARMAAGEGSDAEITDPRVYRMRMSLMFGIDLTPEELAELGLF